MDDLTVILFTPPTAMQLNFYPGVLLLRKPSVVMLFAAKVGVILTCFILRPHGCERTVERRVSESEVY